MVEAPVKRLEKSSRSIADEREVSRGGDPSVTGEGRFAPKSAGIFPNPGGTTDRTVRPELRGSGRFCLRMEEPSHDAEEYWQLPVCIKGVTAQTSKGVAHYHYNSLQDAYDDQKRWFLFLDKRHAFVLPKEAMTMGNPEMFVDFWKSKSGKDMIKIKSRRLHR